MTAKDNGTKEEEGSLGTPKPILPTTQAKMPSLKRLSVNKIDELMGRWEREIEVQEAIIESAGEGENTAEPTQRIRELGRWIKKAEEEKEKKVTTKKRRGAAKKGDERPEVVGFVAPGGEIVETIYDPQTQKSQFAIYYPTGKIDFEERFRIGEVDYWPIEGKMVKTGAVLLPSAVGDHKETYELVEIVHAFLTKYVDFGEERPFFSTLSAYYVLLTWVYDNFTVVPYMRAIGPPGVGKTRYLRAMQAVCYRGINLGGATTGAFLRRSMETYRGTGIMDEADFRKGSEMHELFVKVANMGYQADGLLGIMEPGESGRAWEEKLLSAFCPKVMATRRPFQDEALESRCITHHFTTTAREGITLSIPPLILWEEARAIRNLLLPWRFENYDASRLTRHYPMRKGLEPRLQELMGPMEEVMKGDDESLKRYRAFMEEYQEDLREERAAEEPGLLLKGIIACVREGAGLTYENIKKAEPSLEDLSPQRLGQIRSIDLGLKIERKGRIKTTAIEYDPQKLAKLCNTWGVEPLDPWPETGPDPQGKLPL